MDNDHWPLFIDHWSLNIDRFSSAIRHGLHGISPAGGILLDNLVARRGNGFALAEGTAARRIEPVSFLEGKAALQTYGGLHFQPCRPRDMPQVIQSILLPDPEKPGDLPQIHRPIFKRFLNFLS
jgi:hypothetical protein